jgi:hypothetical protein
LVLLLAAGCSRPDPATSALAPGSKVAVIGEGGSERERVVIFEKEPKPGTPPGEVLIFFVPVGSAATVLADEGDKSAPRYVRVRTEEGRLGWTFRQYLRPSP